MPPVEWKRYLSTRLTRRSRNVIPVATSPSDFAREILSANKETRSERERERGERGAGRERMGRAAANICIPRSGRKCTPEQRRERQEAPSRPHLPPRTAPSVVESRDPSRVLSPCGRNRRSRVSRDPVRRVARGLLFPASLRASSDASSPAQRDFPMTLRVADRPAGSPTNCSRAAVLPAHLSILSFAEGYRCFSAITRIVGKSVLAIAMSIVVRLRDGIEIPSFSSTMSRENRDLLSSSCVIKQRSYTRQRVNRNRRRTVAPGKFSWSKDPFESLFAERVSIVLYHSSYPRPRARGCSTCGLVETQVVRKFSRPRVGVRARARARPHFYSFRGARARG